jgi:hypothetical protein
MSAMKEEISLPQAAQRLQVSWRTAWDMIMLGGIEGEYRAGRWYIDARSVEAVASRNQEPVTEEGRGTKARRG